MYVCFMRFSTIFTVRSLKSLFNYCALFSLYRSWADRSKFDFVSSLRALCSLSQGAPLLPKSRFTQERRAKERFQRAMCPALVKLPLFPKHPKTPFVPETSVVPPLGDKQKHLSVILTLKTVLDERWERFLHMTKKYLRKLNDDSSSLQYDLVGTGTGNNWTVGL